MSAPLQPSPSDSDLVGLEAIPLSENTATAPSSASASKLLSPDQAARTATPSDLIGSTAAESFPQESGSAPPSPGTQERRDANLAQLLARGVDFDAAKTALACTGGDSLDAALALLTEQRLALGESMDNPVNHPHIIQKEPPSTLTEIPAPSEPSPHSPPLPRRIKSILKTSGTNSNLNTSPFFAFQQNNPNGGNPSTSVFSSAFAAASSTLGSKTSEWLKRNLSIDVQVAAANLSTSIRNLLPPTSPPNPEEMDAALGHLPVNFDPTLASAKDIPPVWLTVAADQDARIPPLSSSCVLYDAVDRRWTRHLLKRQRLAKARRLKSGGRKSPPIVVSNAYAPDASDGLSPVSSAAASPSTSSIPAPSLSEYSQVRTMADSDHDDHPLFGGDDNDDDSSDSELASDARDPYDPLLPGYANTKRVRFVLPADSLASSPPMQNGVITTPSTHPRTVAPTDHLLDGTDMVVVEPEVMGAAKGLYSAREVVQAYVAACTDRRTRPLKAVMDAFLPHLQAAAGMAGPSRNAALTVSGSTTPASLVIENMHLRRQDLIALGSVLELEFGLLDLRLTNVSLTNDLARYLLALLYRVDSCPSVSLADNPDLMRPMPVPGSLAPYLEQERHRQQLLAQQQQHQQEQQRQQQLEQQQQQQQSASASAAPMAVGPTASLAAITNTIRRRSSMASFSGLFSGNSGASSPASSAPSTPTTLQPAVVAAPALPSLDQLPFPPLLAPFPSTIAAYIQRSVALRSLDLSGIPLGSGWADLRPLARALRDGPDGLGATLQILTLDRCKLTTASLSQLCPAIRQSNLSSVSFRSNCIDPMGAGAIAGMLIASTDPDSRLTARYDPLWRDVVMGKRMRGVVVLDLSDNSIKSGVKVLGEALAKCAHVKHLLLANNAIQGASFATFCRSMSTNIAIELLDVSLNTFSSDKEDVLAMSELANWLGQRPDIPTTPSLALSNSTVDPANAVPTKVGPPCPLKCLSLAKCTLSNPALIALSNGLVRNTTLERLNVAANEAHLGAYMALAHALLAHPRITRVELGPPPSELEVDKTSYVRELARICQRNEQLLARETQFGAMKDALDRAWAVVRGLAVAKGQMIDADGQLVGGAASAIAPPAEASGSATPPRVMVSDESLASEESDPMAGPSSAHPPPLAESAAEESLRVTVRSDTLHVPKDSMPRGPSPPPRHGISEDKIRAMVDKCLEFRVTLNEYIMSQEECDPRFMDQVLHWNDVFAELLARS